MACANNRGDNIYNIRLSGDTGAHILVKINNVKCLALIDTGASRSCMSTEQHEDIGAPALEPLPPGAQLRSATGTSMEAHGLATCHVQIGQKVYVQRFIVCHRMMTPVIIGRDFLSTYKLNITWGDEGTMEVLKEGKPVARTVGGVCHYPVVTTKRICVPPRMVASIPVLVNLPPFGGKTLFRFIPLGENVDLGENAFVYPVDYATWRGGLQQTVQTIINLSEEMLTLAEETPLGYFEREEKDKVIIDQEGLFQVNIEQPWDGGELEDRLFPPGGDGFITSPADVDPRPPVKLKDAEVSPEHRQAFEELCEEFADVFSQNSGDLGKTPLMKMEIPTGDNVTNQPASLWSGTEACTVGPGGGGNTREGRSDYAKHLPMGQSNSDSSEEDCSRGTPQEEDVCRL